MKIWACAKGANGFINRDDGRYKLYFIWQALRMRRLTPSEFNALTFFSTHSRENKRREMVAVSSGFFRYKKVDTETNRPSDSDGESLSHACLVAILSQLKTINFAIDDKIVPFTFTRLVAEEVRLRFGNGNTYIPDLYGEFTAENPYYEQWGGKVAIEVCYTNPCSMQKINDFRDHGIPIIEIKITDGIKVEKYVKSDDVEGSLERRYQQIAEIVSKKLYCKILSDPVSTKFHQAFKNKIEKERATIAEKSKKELTFLFHKYREAESSLSSTTKAHDDIIIEKKLLQSTNAELLDNVSRLKKSVEDLEIELGKYKTAYNTKTNEVGRLKIELEEERAGFLSRIWRYISPAAEKKNS